jgi:hypothetical protein
MLDDPEAEAWLGGGDEDLDRKAHEIGLFLVDRFGREAPLRAEMRAQAALAQGDSLGYRLF